MRYENGPKRHRRRLSCKSAGLVTLTLFLLVACDIRGIDALWKQEHVMLEKYGEQFLMESGLVEVLKKSDEHYAIRTKDGGLLEVDFQSSVFTWKDRVGEVKRANTLARVTNERLSEESTLYWISALKNLNTFLLSKQELPGCNGVHISSYSNAPLLTAPSAGWFYVPTMEKNRIYCVGTRGFLQKSFGYNGYFRSIRPVSEEWYYGERK
jgi:hypothetical protein